MTYARDASGTWHRIRDDVCAPNGDHAVLGACGHRFTVRYSATELRAEYAEHDTCCGCREVMEAKTAQCSETLQSDR